MPGEIKFVQPRNVRGEFQTFSSDVKDLMRKESLEYIEQVSDRIDAEIKRRKDSTGQLKRATSDPRNRSFTPSTWTAGEPKFLNNFGVKYWRTIEYGSAAVWAHPFTGTKLLLHPEGKFSGGPRPGRPFRTVNKNYKMSNDLRDQGFQIRYVSHEIEGMHAYREVYRQYGWGDRTQRSFNQLIKKSFRLQPKVIS